MLTQMMKEDALSYQMDTSESQMTAKAFRKPNETKLDSIIEWNNTSGTSFSKSIIPIQKRFTSLMTSQKCHGANNEIKKNVACWNISKVI